jgi:hypothetical protein
VAGFGSSAARTASPIALNIANAINSGGKTPGCSDADDRRRENPNGDASDRASRRLADHPGSACSTLRTDLSSSQFGFIVSTKMESTTIFFRYSNSKLTSASRARAHHPSADKSLDAQSG